MLYPCFPARAFVFQNLLPRCFPDLLPRIEAAMPKLSKTFLDKLAGDSAEGERFVWDSDLKGYGVRIKKSGSASFLIQYRTPQGRTRRLAFGKVGVLTPDEARAKARKLLAQVLDGADPSAERHDARAARTVAELCASYMEAAEAGLVTTRFGKAKRASTIVIDRGRVQRHIVPLIGNDLVEKLTRATVQRMADSIALGKTAGVFKTGLRGKAVVAGGAGTAGRVVELLGGIWTWAEGRGLASGVNPTRGVRKIKGDAKDRVLSAAELAALGKALREHEADYPAAVAALRLIALTGLRREEACGLRWSEIDRASSCVRLTLTKTGRSVRTIGAAAFAVLDGVARGSSDWVFPNARGDGSADLKKALAAIFDAAGLADARAHDLRRTFASVAADEGYGDASIGELLGHARRGVTERHYIRRADAALIEAASRVSSRIASAMGGESAEVLTFPRSGAQSA